MKPLKLVTTPTRNRRLNELIGLLVLVSAILLLLALISYRPTDPSFDTVGGFGNGRPAHNWTGLIGAWIADLLLQIEGLTAFCLPVLGGALGWTWLRSRPAGSPGAKLFGILLCMIFGPALLGLLPGHLHFLYGLPIAGLVGRLASDALVAWLNYPGACVVSASMVAIALYLSTTFSFNTAREWLAIRFAFVMAWRDRLVNWRAARARAKEMKAEARQDKIREKELVKARKAAARLEKQGFQQEKIVEPLSRAAHADDENDAPGHRQRGFAEMFAEEPIAPSIWEQIPQARVPDPEPEPVVEQAPPPVLKPQLVTRRETRPEPLSDQTIAVGGRADAEARPVTVAPKSVSGFKLPPSTLLHRSEDATTVREDELRVEAQILVEKCAEFDVMGQVEQHQSRPGGDDFRIPSRRRRQVQPRNRPGRRPVPGDARGEHPDRAHGGQEHRRHPGAEPRPRDHLAARCDRGGKLPHRQEQAHAGHGQGHQRAHRYRRSHHHAARADCRLDGQRQIGRHQRHDHVGALQGHARAGAADPGRSEACGTGHVRGHPAPLHADHHRAQARGQRSPERGARDGTPPEAAGLAQRAQHRPVQQAL